MSLTTRPFFVRSRRLDIRRLERKQPECLQVVHVILREQVKHVLDTVAQLEMAYYGRGRRPEEELGRWETCTRTVLQAVRQSIYLSTLQIEGIIKVLSDPNTQFKVDLFQLNSMKECYRKVMDYMPGRFSDVISDSCSILKYLIKYCVSFYTLKEDLEDEKLVKEHVYLDTADNYEKKRRLFIQQIRKQVERVSSLSDRFKAGGIFLSDFTTYAKEIGRKAQVDRHAPFLLLFPEACESVRLACSVMLDWLVLDKDFAVFIANDVTELEKRRVETLRRMRDAQNNYYQKVYKLKELRRKLGADEEVLEKFDQREDDLLLEEEILINQTNDIQLEIEIKEYRIDELLKHDMNIEGSFIADKVKELREVVREKKLILPGKKRELESVRHRARWIEEQKLELLAAKKTLVVLEKELQHVERHKLEVEIEFEDLLKTIKLAKHIHLYKSSPNTVEKIYHELPVESNCSRLTEECDTSDPFCMACVVVSEKMEMDWPKLYRALPFYPPRGNNTIDADIAQLSQLESRYSLQELTRKCLNRWRRFHTRAKLDDLRNAVADVKRVDVLEAMETALKEPEEEAEEEEPEPNPFLEPELQYLLKDVEKFDQLRAANIL